MFNQILPGLIGMGLLTITLAVVGGALWHFGYEVPAIFVTVCAANGWTSYVHDL